MTDLKLFMIQPDIEFPVDENSQIIKECIVMKLYRVWMMIAVVTTLAAISTMTGKASAQECPFAQDDVIFYHSPSTIMESDTIRSVFSTDEAQQALDLVCKKARKEFKKAEEEFKKELESKPENGEKLNYLKNQLQEALGEDVTVRSVLKAYFQHVDGVVLAVNVPEDTKMLPEGFSLTYIIDFDPGQIFDIRKVVDEGEELFIEKNEAGTFLCRLVKKENDEEKTIYVGVTKIKDMEEYVVIFGVARENVETKLARFQATNEFVTKRLGDAKPYFEDIFKATLFEKARHMLGNNNDPQYKDIVNFVAKAKSLRVKAVEAENGMTVTTELETCDADTAKMFHDLAVGGVAALSLKAEKTELTEEQKSGLQLLKKIAFAYSTDDAFVTASLDLDKECVKCLAKKFVWDKIKEKCQKESD